MKLDMNNIVIFLLIVFCCAMGGFYMSTISGNIEKLTDTSVEQSKQITTLITEVKNLKENNGEIEMHELPRN
jgi:activator of 2-hydroxyglutaryl-CoA dehydratase